MRLIGLDPGGTTGWAIMDISETTARWRMGQIGPQEHHAELYAFLEREHVQKTVLISESFEYRREQRTNVELISREYIGVAKLFAQERGTTYVQQTAAQGKAFWTDEKLKKTDLYVVGQQHARDATRHVLYYFMNHSNLAPTVLADYLKRLK